MAQKKKFEIDIEVNSTPVKNLKTQLREATEEAQRLASAEVVDTEALEAAVKKTAELKDVMADVNEQVAVFASGSKYEQVSNSLGQVGSAISSLDFGKAQDRAQALATAAKAITFGDAIQSVKQLGSTFLTIGKALLTNPLFLLAAIIIGVVAAIYKILDSLGILKTIFEAVGKAIDWVIGLFKSLTDWLGITDNAGKDAANSLAESFEASADRQRKAQESIVAGIDHRIRMAKLEGKDVTELERRKRAEIEKTAKLEAMASIARLQAAEKSGDLSEEEIAELKEKVRQTKLAYQQTLADTKYFEAQIRKAKKDEADKAAEDEKKANEKAQSDAEKAAKEAAARRKAYADARFQAARTTRDLELEMMAEGVEKEVALSNERYARLIEDTKKNEKLLQSEKDIIIAQYESLRLQKEKELIEKTNAEKREAELKAQQDYSNLLLSLNENTFIQQKAQIEQNAADRLDLLKKQLEEGLITKEQFDAAEVAMEADKQRQLDALKGGGDGMSVVERAQAEAEALLLIEQQKLEAGIINEQEYAERRKEIERDLQNTIQELDAQTAQAKRDSAQDYLAIAAGGINAISSLMQTSMDNEIKAAEGNEAKQEQLRKKAFEQQKKMQIASAFINMAQGIISGLGAPFPMNIAMPILAGVTGLANIAKIKSTTYQGGGGAASSASTPSMPNVSSPQRMGPNVNFQGNAGANNNVGAGGSSPMNITLENKVSVSAVEMTDVQQSNTTLKESAQL